MTQRRGLAFLALGSICLAVGLVGLPALLCVGAGFFAAGIFFLIRDRREADR